MVTDYHRPHLWCKAKQFTCRTAKGVYIARLLLLFTFRGKLLASRMDDLKVYDYIMI